MKSWWQKMTPMKRAIWTVVLAFIAITVAMSFATVGGYTNKPQDIYTIQAIVFIPFAAIVLMRARNRSA